MRLSALAVVLFAAAAVLPAAAHAAPDPLFGDDPHAKAVLDCHANYARRFATATVKAPVTPTEVATAAYAHCIGQLNAFAQSVAANAQASDKVTAFLDPVKYQAAQVTQMRDYAFAYTLDTYLTAIIAF